MRKRNYEYLLLQIENLQNSLGKIFDGFENQKKLNKIRDTLYVNNKSTVKKAEIKKILKS